MRLLLVIPSLEFGGAQTFLLKLAAALSEHHEVSVYDIHPAKSDQNLVKLLDRRVNLYSSFYERVERALKKHHLKRVASWLDKANARLAIRRRVDKLHFRSLLRRKKIQLINSHMYLADSFVVLTAPERMPIVSTFHGCYSLLIDHISANNNLKQMYFKQFMKTFSRLDAFIWLSKQQLVLFTAMPSLPCPQNRQIYNGFEVAATMLEASVSRTEFGIPDTSFVYIMVARGDRTKGWDELIEAFLLLQHRTSRPVDLLLVGWSDHLQSLSEKYAKNERIHFLGQTTSPLDYVAISDVGVLPTFFKAESLPNTVVEYLYCGKPCITTAVAELPNMLDSVDGMAGILVESTPEGPADVESLATAMQRYLDEDGLYAQHCGATRKAFQKFDMKTCVRKYSQLFREVLESRW